VKRCRNPDRECQDFGPVWLEMVESTDDQRLWREWWASSLLGSTVPFGAQIRYFVGFAARKTRWVLQLSSPAWRMAPGPLDRMDEAQKTRRLQLIVQNSRFLILPWVQIKNSPVRPCFDVPGVPEDWQARYNIRPVFWKPWSTPLTIAGLL